MPDGKNLSLQYELKALDELVLERINPERNSIPDQIVSLMGCIDIAKTQKEIIKKKMVGTAYSFSEERYTVTYIHNHQARLSHLIEMLFKYLDDDIVKKSTEYQLVIDQMISQIVALMRFLADTFKDYFNYDAESTVSFKRTASAHFKEQLIKLKSKASVPPPTVLEVALSPIKEFTHNPLGRSVTFRKLMYFDFMVNALEPIIDIDSEPRIIKIALIELNYNSNQFLWYLTNEIEQIILPLETHSEKVEKLSWYMKQVNQIQMRTDIAFEPKQESIKEKIINWVVEEICFLEKSMKNETVGKTSEEQDCSFKLPTNLSVPVYGCLIHLMFECEIYDRQQLAQSLRFLAKHTKTKNVNEIAEESIRQKFYKHEQSTKDKVKALVIKMLNKLNDGF
ncbi:MAG: hypothetical protein HC831_24675 [Chloroflexia bacterium]|nr:hypothetical protein [Chloroflexia bacterium]